MLSWLRRRRQAERLAQGDAKALIRDHGAEAYSEARQRERDVLPDGTTHSGRTPARLGWPWRKPDEPSAAPCEIESGQSERFTDEPLTWSFEAAVSVG